MFDIQWTKRAIKDLLTIQPLKQRKAISLAVESLKENPTVNTNVKSLKNHDFGYRLRVGRYRVTFDVEHNKEVRIVTIQEVKKRDERTY